MIAAAFQLGRRTVRALPAGSGEAAVLLAQRKLSDTPPPQELTDYSKVTIRNLATVPFSQLYDILRTASGEQIKRWAHDLARMPQGPQRTIAIIAFYKSLVQVDARTGIDLVVAEEDEMVAGLAIEAMLKAAPESTWGEFAEMMERLPQRRRVGYREDPISKWSCVDPVAVSQFIESHPVEGEDSRLFPLLCFWGEYDPDAAMKWMAREPARQTPEAIRALLSGWADRDRAAAIEFAIANGGRAEFHSGISELAYRVLRKSPDEARSMILRLPPESAEAAMEEVRRMTCGVFVGGMPLDYQRPPEVIAPWMVTLPIELWKDKIGEVIGTWIRHNGESAPVGWLNGLRADLRDAAIADLCTVREEFFSAEPALALAFTISDAAVREQALRKFVQTFTEGRGDSPSAFDGLPVSHEQKAYLLQLLPSNADEG